MCKNTKDWRHLPAIVDITYSRPLEFNFKVISDNACFIKNFLEYAARQALFLWEFPFFAYFISKKISYADGA